MVSIIIPYNEDRGYLHHAIASVEEQGIAELVLSKSDMGVAYNFNRGLEKVKTEWCKVLAEDDMLAACDSLFRLVQFAESSGADVIVANAVNFNEDYTSIIYRSVIPQNYQELASHNTIHGLSTLYRTSAIRAVGGMDESLDTGEEWDMHIRLMKEGYKFVYVDMVVGYHRIWHGQKSTGSDKTTEEKLHRKIRLMEIAKRYI